MVYLFSLLVLDISASFSVGNAQISSLRKRKVSFLAPNLDGVFCGRLPLPCLLVKHHMVLKEDRTPKWNLNPWNQVCFICLFHLATVHFKSYLPLFLSSNLWAFLPVPLGTSLDDFDFFFSWEIELGGYFRVVISWSSLLCLLEELLWVEVGSKHCCL